MINESMFTSSNVTKSVRDEGPAAKLKKSDKANQKDMMFYNLLLFPLMPGLPGVFKLNVPGEHFVYWIHANAKWVPSYVYTPSSAEIVDRLILKAIKTKKIDKLNL